MKVVLKKQKSYHYFKKCLKCKNRIEKVRIGE